MSWIAQFAPGTLPQWGTFFAMIGMLVGLVTVWVRGKPDRMRAATENAKMTGDQYAAQIRDFRAEVHKYRNELMEVQHGLNIAESLSQQRGDRLSMMMLIIHLLIGELRKLDPDSTVIGQAESLLREVRARDGESAALEAARKTQRAADETVAEIKAGEL